MLLVKNQDLRTMCPILTSLVVSVVVKSIRSTHIVVIMCECVYDKSNKLKVLPLLKTCFHSLTENKACSVMFCCVVTRADGGPFGPFYVDTVAEGLLFVVRR